MTHPRRIATDRAPAAIGPYAQALEVEGWIYASGQIAIEPASGRFEGGTVSQQTDRVLQNLRAIVEAGGGSLRTVVKTTVYLTDLANFQEMNAVYQEHFGDHHPARATVGVAGLPAGAAVEIDAVARVLPGV